MKFFLFLTFMRHYVWPQVDGYSFLPEASREGYLRPFKSYADVTLFHYHVPLHVAHATWEFAAFVDHPSCAVREVHIYLQHGSYPVMPVNNATFPENFYTGRTDLFHIVTKTAYQPHDATVFPVHSPLPGSWFAAAFLAYWDKPITQQGLVVQCYYTLGSVALWSQVLNVATVSPGASLAFKTTETYSYYKMFIPSGTRNLSLHVTNCSSHGSTGASLTCIQSVNLSARRLPIFDPNHAIKISDSSEYVFSVTQPYIDSYYYLLMFSDSPVTFQLQLFLSECNTHVSDDGSLRIISMEALPTAKDILERDSNKTAITGEDHGILPSGEEPSFHQKYDEDEVCTPYIQMARITHNQNFVDTFFLQVNQGREFYTTWLPVTESRPATVQFDIMPFLDTGGTLNIAIHMDEVGVLHNAENQLMHISACLSKGHPPLFQGIALHCSPEQGMLVDSVSLSAMGSTKLVPFPEPDTWFISLMLFCSENGTSAPCKLQETLVMVDVRTQPCVFAGQPCGPHGTCQQIHKGLHFFTACACHAGYHGWGCNEASEGISRSKREALLKTFVLIGSNLFFLPVVDLSLERSLYTQALVYAATMIFSMLYHACDQNVYPLCVTKFEVLQFCDFFCSILSLWVTLVALSGLPPQISSTVHMIGVIITAIGVQYNRTGLLVFLVPLGLGLCVPLITWIDHLLKRKGFSPFHWWSLVVSLPGVLLAATGVFLFAFIETEENYWYVHSIWHVAMALSLSFLLPRPEKASLKKPETNIRETTEMSILNESEGGTSNAVFVINSDLDDLLPNPPNLISPA